MDGDGSEKAMPPSEKEIIFQKRPEVDESGLGKDDEHEHEHCHPSRQESLSGAESANPSRETPSSRFAALEVHTEESDTQYPVFIEPAPKSPRAYSPSKAAENLPERDDDADPTPEIKYIMQQFQIGDGLNTIEGLESSNEGQNLRKPISFPPRASSLEPGLERPIANTEYIALAGEPFKDTVYSTPGLHGDTSTLPGRLSSLPQVMKPGTKQSHQSEHTPSKTSTISLPKELPPAPDPEPDLPFDFHRFLEQLRHRTADPVAKYLRSFLTEFGKRQWTVPEQVKFISDFLIFIANKMAQCDVWRGLSDAEFDNAREGMEKLVMNRLYSQTFSPVIPPPAITHGSKGKRKDVERLLGTGRQGQHQEDIERDEILSQKVRIYNWLEEEHLDIKQIGSSSKRLLNLAQQELLKIRSYRAPRDKVICILNSCKVIFGLLRNSKSPDTSADAFVPLLILVVLRANPDHLVSNVQYILRFRNQEKLGGEAGYYLSSLMGAIQFIENLDRTSLTISDEEFEKKVEHSVSTIAERNQQPVSQEKASTQSSAHVTISEKAAPSQPQVVTQNSAVAEAQKSTFTEKLQRSGGRDVSEEDTVVNGLLRTIQRPLSSLGKIFTEEDSTNQSRGKNSAAPAPPPRRLSPVVSQPPRHSDEFERTEPKLSGVESLTDDIPRNFKAEDAAARQASAEAAEAHRRQRAEHQNVVETLAGMFPNLDRGVIDDVVREKQGRVCLAVDACLALSS